MSCSMAPMNKSASHQSNLGPVSISAATTPEQVVAIDLVGHHLLDSLLDAMYDHFISCSYQRVCFTNLPCPPDLAKPRRPLKYSSLWEAFHNDYT